MSIESNVNANGLTPASRPDEGSTKSRIKSVLVKVLGTGVDPLTLADSTLLLNKGLGLDSFTMLTFLGRIEDEFQIDFLDHELNLELVRDIDSLHLLVNAKLQQRSETGPGNHLNDIDRGGYR
jgi:acyl carrier protein